MKEGNYAVLMLVKNDTWSPRDGDAYKLVLEQFSSTVVDAQVLSSTRSGGELLVRLAVLGDVSDVLYMRTCRAQLGEYVDCMEVPSRRCTPRTTRWAWSSSPSPSPCSCR